MSVVLSTVSRKQRAAETTIIVEARAMLKNLSEKGKRKYDLVLLSLVRTVLT